MRALVLIAALAACAEDVADPIKPDVDYSDPKSVLGSVFWAARSGDTTQLAGLCDAGANQAAARVCAVTALGADFEAFRKNFARGRLNGEPRVTGDRALLKFLYGPKGTDRETMTLVRRDGRWYLQSF